MLNKIVFRCIPVGITLAILMNTSCNSGAPAAESAVKEDSAAHIEAATPADDGFVQLFDGKTLQNWEGDSVHWKAVDGTIMGEVTPATLLKTNTFLIWKGGQPADFELIADFKITKEGNSGINYRSEMFPGVPHALKGYQADIDGANNYTGQNYEERGRTTLAYRGQKVTVPSVAPAAAVSKDNAWTPVVVDGSLGNADSLKGLIKSEDWNEVRLIVKGNHLQHFINGTLMSDVTDNDSTNRKASGLLGVQVHVGPPMKVQYKNIRMKQL